MELTLRRQLCGAKQNKKQTLLDTDADRSSYLVSKYKGEGQACIGGHFSASRSANDSRDDDAFDRYGNTVSPLCDRVTRLHWSALARSMARVPGFLRLRTNRHPGISLLFATFLERRRRLSSRNRVPDPFMACATVYLCSSTVLSPLSFLLVRPARGERCFLHPARTRYTFLERKRNLSRSVSQLLEGETRIPYTI